MTGQEEFEKRGWHFEDTGRENMTVAWKNVTLKDDQPGCVTLSPDAIVLRRRSCANQQEFFQILWDVDETVESYSVGGEDDPEVIPLFLHKALEKGCAEEIYNDVYGIWQSRLVR